MHRRAGGRLVGRSVALGGRALGGRRGSLSPAETQASEAEATLGVPVGALERERL